jgi:hypothetical protein
MPLTQTRAMASERALDQGNVLQRTKEKQPPHRSAMTCSEFFQRRIKKQKKGKNDQDAWKKTHAKG